MRVETRYIAKDGTEFKNAEDCAVRDMAYDWHALAVELNPLEAAILPPTWLIAKLLKAVLAKGWRIYRPLKDGQS